MPEPTDGTPNTGSETPTGGEQQGANTGETPKITPELQKIIDEQVSAATKKANEEAAKNRLKLKEFEEKQKAEAEKKLEEQKEFEKLANTRKTELETLTAENERLKKIEADALERDKQRHDELLKKIPEAQRDNYKEFTTHQLELVTRTLSVNANSQGSERQQGSEQQQAPSVPTVPFAGQNNDVHSLLLKTLGG